MTDLDPYSPINPHREIPLPSLAVKVTLASTDGKHELELGVFNQGVVLEGAWATATVVDVATGEPIIERDAVGEEWTLLGAMGEPNSEIPDAPLTRCFIQAAT